MRVERIVVIVQINTRRTTIFLIVAVAIAESKMNATGILASWVYLDVFASIAWIIAMDPGNFAVGQLLFGQSNKWLGGKNILLVRAFPPPFSIWPRSMVASAVLPTKAIPRAKTCRSCILKFEQMYAQVSSDGLRTWQIEGLCSLYFTMIYRGTQPRIIWIAQCLYVCAIYVELERWLCLVIR
jgi:hypothetical protein